MSPADLPPQYESESAEVREAQPATPAEAPGVFVRAGAGIGRGALFVGSDNAREAARIPLSLEIGAIVREHLGASVALVVEPGRTDHGVAMTRIALGGSCEAHFGPVFFGVGPHTTWFGATRKSGAGDAVLWRLGVGAHAMLGVDVHASSHAGVFTALRVDGDALLSVGERTVPWASVTGVVGMSFY
jgi:hypothetical protein